MTNSYGIFNFSYELVERFRHVRDMMKARLGHFFDPAPSCANCLGIMAGRLCAQKVSDLCIFCNFIHLFLKLVKKVRVAPPALATLRRRHPAGGISSPDGGAAVGGWQPAVGEISRCPPCGRCVEPEPIPLCVMGRPHDAAGMRQCLVAVIKAKANDLEGLG